MRKYKEKKCKECGDLFKSQARYFCSKKCRDINRIGKKMPPVTDEWRRKQRESKLGKRHTEETKKKYQIPQKKFGIEMDIVKHNTIVDWVEKCLMMFVEKLVNPN